MLRRLNLALGQRLPDYRADYLPADPAVALVQTAHGPPGERPDPAAARARRLGRGRRAPRAAGRGA